MRNARYSAIKRALNRVQTPPDFDALLHQAGLQRSAQYQRQRALGWAGFFALGLLSGAAAGILFAPKRGKEIRAQMRHQVRDKMPMARRSSTPGQQAIYDELN